MKSCWPTLRLNGFTTPAESLARAVVDQSGGGGETRAVREAAELDGGEARTLLPVRERCGVKIGEPSW